MRKIIMCVLGSLVAFSPAKAAESSYVLDVGGIATALVKGQRVVGEIERTNPPPAFVPTNDFQRQIVTLTPEYARELLARLTGEELRVVASRSEAEINDILATAGSRIRIKFGPNDKFAVVSILNVGVQFKVPADVASKDEKTGVVSYFDINGKPAMRFTSGTHAIAMKQMEGTPHPVIVLTAQNGDLVILHRTDDRHAQLSAKEHFAKKLVKCAQSCPATDDFLGAIVPMTLVDTEVQEVGRLKGLEFAETNWYVSQAKQQVRFYLDPKGATVKTETVVVKGQRSMQKSTYYELSGGFYAVMYRPGMTVPYFSGWISPNDFKVPPTYTLPTGWKVTSKR